MKNLAEYRRSDTRLADFLPWAALVGEGVVLNKDCSFQRTKVPGPDLDSGAGRTRLIAGRLSSACAVSRSGWAVLLKLNVILHFGIRQARFRMWRRPSSCRRQFEERELHESSCFLTFSICAGEDAARAGAVSV